MARVTLSFAEAALEDLESLRAWYAEQQVPAVGQRLVAEIVARVQALQDHPDMGRIVPEFGLAFLRELIHPPFRIVCTAVIKSAYVWFVSGVASGCCK